MSYNPLAETALQAANNLADLASTSTARSNLSLNNVENTALSTWAGTSNVTTLGVIASATNFSASVLGMGTTTTLEGLTKELVIKAGTSGDATAGISVQCSRSSGNTSAGKFTWWNRGNESAIWMFLNDSATDGGGMFFGTSVSGAAGTTTERLRIAPDGSVSINGTSNASAVGLLIKNKATTDVNLILKQIALQTGDYMQWQNSSGTVISSIDTNGCLTLPDGVSSSPAIYFRSGSANAVGLYQSATNTMSVAINGAQKIKFSALGITLISGNVVFANNSGLVIADSGATIRDAFYCDGSNNMIIGSTGYAWNSVGFYFNSATSKALISNTGSFSRYNNVATAGIGLAAIYAAGRSTAQTAAVASVATYTVGAADGSFEVSANVLVTTSTVHSFTATCAYTDEGNTTRTLTLQFSNLAGTLLTAIANAAGAVPYEGVPLHIRCKAGTTITIATTGTFTTVTYNVEGVIKQMA